MQPLPHDYLQLIHDFQARQQENEVAGITALKRLLPIAQRDSGQSGVIGRFLLGLYNGQAHRFDLTELRRLDPGSVRCVPVRAAYGLRPETGSA